MAESKLKRFLKSEVVTVSSNARGNAELYSGNDRIVVCAKVNAPAGDYIALAFMTRGQNIWVRILGWDFSPVQESNIGVTYWYLD